MYSPSSIYMPCTAVDAEDAAGNKADADPAAVPCAALPGLGEGRRSTSGVVHPPHTAWPGTASLIKC